MEQQRIWDHFQGKGVGSFDQAGGRYRAMAALARRQHGRDGGRVLNVGIGPARLERALLERGWRVSALDPGEGAVATLAGSAIDARCGYAQTMPFDDQSFDVVIASEVLEHIEPVIRRRALLEVSRVLVPGGWFIGSVPYREVLSESEVVCPDCGKVFHRWGHVSSFDEAALAGELSAVFDRVQLQRRSFVDWAGVRSPGALAKAVVRSVLGRLGEAVATPSLCFAARRRAGP